MFVYMEGENLLSDVQLETATYKRHASEIQRIEMNFMDLRSSFRGLSPLPLNQMQITSWTQ